MTISTSRKRRDILSIYLKNYNYWCIAGSQSEHVGETIKEWREKQSKFNTIKSELITLAVRFQGAVNKGNVKQINDAIQMLHSAMANLDNDVFDWTDILKKYEAFFEQYSRFVLAPTNSDEKLVAANLANEHFEAFINALQAKEQMTANSNTNVTKSSPIQNLAKHKSSFSKKNDNLRLASVEDLMALGYTAYEIVERLVENDKRLYPEIGEENEGDASVWAEYLSSYPDTFRYIVDENNNIVGNWSFLAVSEEEHGELLRSGALLESSFSVDNTDFLFFEGDYLGYILNLSLNEGFATLANYQLLFDSFSEQMLAFAERGIFFKEWYVNVFRRDHAAMYKRMGFRHLCKNKVVGDLYAANVSSLSKGKLFATNARLCELYEAHFE